MLKHARRPKSNKLYRLLDHFFWTECFVKLKNPEEIRKISSSLFSGDEGLQYVSAYFKTHFKTIENLRDVKADSTHATATPLFVEIMKYIKDNHFSEDKDTYIIQLGSSSALDLKFLYGEFPKLNYISTDVNDVILNFQKEKSNFPNLKFFKCYAEEIDKCFKQLNLKEKKIILFARGSLQYVVPFFLQIFFSKIKLHKNLILFLCEPVILKYTKNVLRISTEQRSRMSFSHNYKQLAEKNNFKTIKEKIMHAQSKDDLAYKHTFSGLHYLCCKIG